MIILLAIISLLSGMPVNTLEYDNRYVYMGTQGQGIYYCDPVSMDLNKIPDTQLPCNYISALYSREQLLIIGTYNGIAILDDDLDLIENYIPADYYRRWITDIAYYQGNYIFANLNGLINYSQGNFSFIPTPFVPSVFWVEDTLWLGTDRGLLFTTDLSNFHNSGFSTDDIFSEYLPVTCLIRDSGWFWIGLEDNYSSYSPGGLWLFDGDDQHYRMGRNSGLVFNGLSVLYRHDKIIIACTYCKINGLKKGGGLQILSPEGVVSWLGMSRIFPLINDIIYIPETDQFWIATDQGVEIVEDSLLVDEW
jgi:ligand-binding sensor domain-containing protein